MEDTDIHKEKIIIRRARIEDDTAIGNLLIEAYVATYAKKMPEVVVSDKRKADLRNVATKRESATVLVAELSKEIIASATLFPSGHIDSESVGEKASNLRYMAVLPKFHRKGLSTLLLDACMQIAASYGDDSIELHVRKGAKGIASMYVRYGFTRNPSGDLNLLPEIFLEGYRLSLATVLKK